MLRLTFKRAKNFFIFLQVTYFGAAIYLPALALKAVTPISLQWIIVVSSVVCILYTTLVSFTWI